MGVLHGFLRVGGHGGVRVCVEEWNEGMSVAGVFEGFHVNECVAFFGVGAGLASGRENSACMCRGVGSVWRLWMRVFVRRG